MLLNYIGMVWLYNMDAIAIPLYTMWFHDQVILIQRYYHSLVLIRIKYVAFC